MAYYGIWTERLYSFSDSSSLECPKDNGISPILGEGCSEGSDSFESGRVSRELIPDLQTRYACRRIICKRGDIKNIINREIYISSTLGWSSPNSVPKELNGGIRDGSSPTSTKLVRGSKILDNTIAYIGPPPTRIGEEGARVLLPEISGGRFRVNDEPIYFIDNRTIVQPIVRVILRQGTSVKMNTIIPFDKNFGGTQRVYMLGVAAGGGGGAGGRWPTIGTKQYGGAGGGSGFLLIAALTLDENDDDIFLNVGQGGLGGVGYNSPGRDGTNTGFSHDTKYAVFAAGGGRGGEGGSDSIAQGGEGGVLRQTNIDVFDGKVIIGSNGSKGGNSNSTGSYTFIPSFHAVRKTYGEIYGTSITSMRDLERFLKTSSSGSLNGDNNNGRGGSGAGGFLGNGGDGGFSPTNGAPGAGGGGSSSRASASNLSPGGNGGDGFMVILF